VTRTARVLVVAPLRIEAAVLRSAPVELAVVRSGMGPARAAGAARAVAQAGADAVVVAGLCGAVAPAVRPGDVVLASELVEDDGTRTACSTSAALTEALRRRGLRVEVGPVWCSERLLGSAERGALVSSGVLAVEMESAWLARALGSRPLTVLRVVADAAGRRLLAPRTLAAGVRALRSLRTAGAAVGDWAANPGLRESIPLQPSREVP
jgi:4-hydroxy-3-methylbut-2-enyl diphosphate reductase